MGKLLLLGAGSSRFTPAKISNLEIWHRADRIEGLSNGDPVEVWPDLSGKGRNLTQITAAKQPSFRTNVLNGRSIVRFAGVDDQLAHTTFSSIPVPFTVVTVESGVGSSAIHFDTADTGGADRNFLWTNASDQWAWGISSGGVSSGISNDNNFHILVAEFVGAGSRLLLDSYSSAIATATQNPTGFRGHRIFCLFNTTGNIQTGDKAEHLVYSKALSASELQDLVGSLSSYYGISVS